MSDVGIDRFTGELVVDRVDLLMDVGRMINPTHCELQVRGAALFGLGQVLFEELYLAEKDPA